MPDPADTAQGGTTSPVGSGPSGRSFNSPTVTTTSSPVSSTSREGGGTTQGDSAKSSAAGAGADAGDGEGGATPTTTSSTTSPTTGQSTRTNNPVSPGARTPDQPAGTSSGAPTNTTASGGTNFKSNSTTKVSDPSRTNPNAGGYPQGGLNQVTPGQANAGAASNLTNGVGGLVNASLNGGLTAPSTIADAITGTAPPSVYGAPSFGAMASINPAYAGAPTTGATAPQTMAGLVSGNFPSTTPSAPAIGTGQYNPGMLAQGAMDGIMNPGGLPGKMQDRLPGAPGFGSSGVLNSPIADALGVGAPSLVAGDPRVGMPPGAFPAGPLGLPPGIPDSSYFGDLMQNPTLPAAPTAPVAPVTTASAAPPVAPASAPSLMQLATIAADPTLAGKIPDRLIGDQTYGPDDLASPSLAAAGPEIADPPTFDPNYSGPFTVQPTGGLPAPDQTVAMNGPTPPAGAPRASTQARLEIPNKVGPGGGYRGTVAPDYDAAMSEKAYPDRPVPFGQNPAEATFRAQAGLPPITSSPGSMPGATEVAEPPGGLPGPGETFPGSDPQVAAPAGPVGPSQQAGQPQTPGELTNRIGYEYGKAKQGLHDLPGKLMESLFGGKFTAGPDLHALQQLRGGGGGIMEGFPQPVDENRDGYDDKSGESIREMERRRYAQQFQLLMSAFM
jgi:hypothetical protein